VRRCLLYYFVCLFVYLLFLFAQMVAFMEVEREVWKVAGKGEIVVSRN
jgi:hypothetical protein